MAFMSDDRAAPHVASGALVRVLEDCCRPFPASSSSYDEWAAAAGRRSHLSRRFVCSIGAPASHRASAEAILETPVSDRDTLGGVTQFAIRPLIRGCK